MIENLILDMGGVILDVDYRKIFTRFSEYGCHHMSSFFTQQEQIPLVDDFEKGLIGAGKFRDEVRKLANERLSDCEIDEIWNSMVLRVRVEDVELIETLRKKYEKIFLFSNTNGIHVEFVKKMFFKAMGYDIFEELFDKVYFSNEIGLRKPDVESFEYVLTDCAIEGKKSLFIDDTRKNIEGAKKAGLNACLLDNGRTLTQLYREGII